MTAPSYSWDLMPSGSAVATSSNTSVGNAIPVVRDLALDTGSYELVLDGGDLATVTELASIRQHVRMRLGTFLGEWFLDQDVGLPYFEQILTKNPSRSVVSQVFRDAILATPGVRSLLSLVLDFNTTTREATVTFRADTDFGELSGSIPTGAQ